MRAPFSHQTYAPLRNGPLVPPKDSHRNALRISGYSGSIALVREEHREDTEMPHRLIAESNTKHDVLISEIGACSYCGLDYPGTYPEPDCGEDAIALWN